MECKECGGYVNELCTKGFDNEELQLQIADKKIDEARGK